MQGQWGKGVEGWGKANEGGLCAGLAGAASRSWKGEEEETDVTAPFLLSFVSAVAQGLIPRIRSIFRQPQSESKIKRYRTKETVKDITGQSYFRDWLP